jgi:DNA-directed RNA polymerase subunit RPC12/RpoP
VSENIAYVCSHCGAEDSLSELVAVEVSVGGWQGVKVETGSDGAPKATVERDNRELDGDYSDPDWGTAECQGFHCAECEHEFPSLAEAVKTYNRVECRECGFDGDPAEHPASCGGELLGLAPPEVNPGQVSLEVAA